MCGGCPDTDFLCVSNWRGKTVRRWVIGASRSLLVQVFCLFLVLIFIPMVPMVLPAHILVCIYYPYGESFLDSTFTLDNKQYSYTVTKILLGVGVRNRQILLLLLAWLVALYIYTYLQLSTVSAAHAVYLSVFISLCSYCVYTSGYSYTPHCYLYIYTYVYYSALDAKPHFVVSSCTFFDNNLI